MRREINSTNWDSRTLDIDGAAGTQAIKITGTSDRVRQIVDNVVRRRQSGEFVADDAIISENADLMPELANELRALEEIRRAFLAAQKAGPINEPLKLLSIKELEAPIDEDTSAEPEELVRVRISGYTITDEVNHGGQATVYKAIQESTGRKVAIKVVYGVHSRTRVRIDREAGILVALDHPNVVGILDRGRTADGSFFIAMDFVEGYSFDEFLAPSCAGGPANLDELVRLFSRICRAVGYAHDSGVLHRDLKPSNIRVDLRGEPHILDFGLARLIQGADLDGFSQHSITASGQLIGSLPWCSPEQAAGKQDEITIRSDVYALGLMLYQAIAGEAPYVNRGLINEVVKNILHATPKPIAGKEFARWGVVSVKLQSIVLRCLEKSHERRFASATELAVALEDCLQHPGRASRNPWMGGLSKRIWLACLTSIVIVAVLLIVPQINNRLLSPRVTASPKVTDQIRDPADQIAPEMVNGRAVFLDDELKMPFVYCPPGTFEMGLRPEDDGFGPGNRRHSEPIEKGFYIATLEVTQGQYLKILPGRSLADPYRGDDLPMGSARWIDAMEFCQKLSERTGKRFRLPTEAEWEYACRAGSTGDFGGSNNLAEMGWYKENTPANMMPKGGTKLPNAWKIYDMHGSVWEWCDTEYDSYDPAYQGHLSAPDKPLKVYRGGDIKASWSLCRSGNRSSLSPTLLPADRLGIRLVLNSDDVK